MNEPKGDKERFEHEAAESQRGLVAEFVYFLAYRKKWWLIPIVAILLLISLFVIIGGSGAAPFIYILF